MLATRVASDVRPPPPTPPATCIVIVVLPATPEEVLRDPAEYTVLVAQYES